MLSIYILNHNYGHYLKECLESVIHQPRIQEVEWIYVDDGSTDHSKEVIEPYRHLFHQILVNETPQGLIKSANKAIRAATGTYVMRLDADDFLSENALDIYLNTLQKDIDIAFPNYFIYTAETQQSYTFKRDSSSATLRSDFPFHGACTLVRKSFLAEINFYDESFSRQDGYYLWLQSLIHQKKLFHIEEPLFYYRIHGNNLTRSFRKLLLNRIEIKKKLLLHKFSDPVYLIVPLQEHLIDQRISVLKAVFDYLEPLQLPLQWVLMTEVPLTSSFLQQDHIQIISREKSKGYGEALEKFLEDKSHLPFVILEPDYPKLMPESILEMLLTRLIQPYDRILSLFLESNSFYKYESSGFSPLHVQKSYRLERNNLFRKAGGLSYFRNLEVYKNSHQKRTGFIEIDHLSTLRFQEWMDIQQNLE